MPTAGSATLSTAAGTRRECTASSRAVFSSAAARLEHALARCEHAVVVRLPAGRAVASQHAYGQRRRQHQVAELETGAAAAHRDLSGGSFADAHRRKAVVQRVGIDVT